MQELRTVDAPLKRTRHVNGIGIVMKGKRRRYHAARQTTSWRKSGIPSTRGQGRAPRRHRATSIGMESIAQCPARRAVRNRPSSTPERLGRLYNDGEPRRKLGEQLRELQLVNDQGRAKKGGA
jgi:hypothetical protein